jgi:hypothetical protein
MLFGGERPNGREEHVRKGWMVPNRYWTLGALSPMAIEVHKGIHESLREL